MPINCPGCFPEPDACEGCRHNMDEKCCWGTTPIPLRDILTLGERICILEDEFMNVLSNLSLNIPSNALSALRKSMDQLKGQMLHLEGKLNEHIDIPKKQLKKKGKSKGLDIG